MYCDHLHEMVESNLDKFLVVENLDRSPFYHFRGQLVNYYEATRRYFTNLVQGLQEWEDKRRNEGL